jgi:predicted nucleic acid-binding protein
VLDASAAVAWASPDEAPPTALAEAIAASRCVAPALWAFEVHNVLLMLERRGRLDTAGYEAAVAALSALGVELESPSWAQVEHAVTRLARVHQLTIWNWRCGNACPWPLSMASWPRRPARKGLR